MHAATTIFALVITAGLFCAQARRGPELSALRALWLLATSALAAAAALVLARLAAEYNPITDFA